MRGVLGVHDDNEIYIRVVLNSKTRNFKEAISTCITHILRTDHTTLVKSRVIKGWHKYITEPTDDHRQIERVWYIL